MKMTNLLWKGAAALMMAVAVSACSGDDEVMEQPAGGGEATEEQTPTLTIVATQDDGADTRLAFVDEKHLEWTPGDQIFVTEAETPTNYVTLDLQETEATKTGTFSTTATLPETWVAGETNLVAYYKANDNMLTSWGTFYITSYLGHTQTENEKMDHLLERNYMKSGEFAYSSSTASSLKFKQQGAIMKFVLEGLGGKTITKLLLCAGDNVFTNNEYISNGKSYKTSYYQVSLYLGAYGSGITVADGGTLTAYMPMGATEATKDVSMTLYAIDTNGNYYSTPVTGGTIAAAKIYTLTKTMEEKIFFSGGTGTETDPYQISSEANLKAFAEWVSITEGASNTYFKQTADITLSDGNWTPIKTFSGTFDGGGHTISGLTYDGSGSSGLFNLMYGAVQNVNLTNVSLKATGSECGGIAVRNLGTITHCSVSGIVEGEIAGGIAGTNEGGTIVACHNSATVSGSAQIGGIAGSITSAAAIIGCYNVGACTSDYVAGGIAGFGTTSGSITACYSTGVVTGAYVGGILGYNSNDAITFSTCYWSGSLSAGVGYGSSEGTTQVTDGNWSTATEAMNTALSTAGYSWGFVENSDTDTNESEPLKLQAVSAVE